jgi:hypothetical protein
MNWRIRPPSRSLIGRRKGNDERLGRDGERLLHGGEVKTNVLWFILGFAVSSLAFATLVHLRNRRVDFTEFVPSDARSMVAESLPWTRSAHMERFGGYLAITPYDGKIGDAFVIPIAKPHFPMIMMHDSTSNALPNSIQIVDRKMRSVTLASRTEDGVWDSLVFGTGMNSNSVSLADTNMDGVFDMRVGLSQQ